MKTQWVGPRRAQGLKGDVSQAALENDVAIIDSEPNCHARKMEKDESLKKHRPKFVAVWCAVVQSNKNCIKTK